MLQSITVSNIAVVSRLEVDFYGGFTTLTGETGAGKSLLIDALNLVLGGRGQVSLIRQGMQDASVTAVFDITTYQDLQAHLHAIGFQQDDPSLMIRRSITKDGRTKCFINDVPISVNGLKDVGEYLIEIHGQFDRLLMPTHHRLVLDEFGALDTFVALTKTAYADWQDTLKKMKDTKASILKNQENRDYLIYCLDELQKINPAVQEEERLLEKRSFLMHHEKIKSSLQGALEELQDKGSVVQSFHTAYRILKNGNVDGILDHLLKNIDDSLSLTQETIESLKSTYRDFGAGDEETSLETIEQRLSALRFLAKKHRCTVDDLVSLLEKFRHEASSLENAGGMIQGLEADERKTRACYEKAASELSHQREVVSQHLKISVEKELAPLKLPATFFVKLTPLPENQWSEHGMETVEFFVTTNPGEAPGPLSKIASGGELSRFMLALKVALNQKSHVPTIIFDEIDTGLGGAVADAMGKRLKELSQTTQVVAITHSPQMAAYADHHYLVAKHLEEGRMQTRIQQLAEDDKREEELARMLAGETITPEAKAAAAVLLKDTRS